MIEDALVPMLMIICVASIVATILGLAIYVIKEWRRDKRFMKELIDRGYKKETIEDFCEIYNVELKHVVKHKTIENDLISFNRGGAVDLPKKNKNTSSDGVLPIIMN